MSSKKKGETPMKIVLSLDNGETVFPVAVYDGASLETLLPNVRRDILRRLRDSGFQVYYLRLWSEPLNGSPAIKLDFGSHTKFLYLSFADGSEIDAESFLQKFLND